MMQLRTLTFVVVLLVCSGGVAGLEWEEKVVSRFQSYLKINTAHPNPLYHEAVEFLVGAAQSLPLEHHILEIVKGKPLLLLKWLGSRPDLPAILLYSHTDVVPAEAHHWQHPPFSGHVETSSGNIFGRGSQDMKCVGLQHLEALHLLHTSGFTPLRTIYVVYSPDEEIGGHDGAGVFVESPVFREMNIGIVLDEGLASPEQEYRVFYAEKAPWWLTIKAVGDPGHGSKLYDNSAMENLQKSIESIMRFRASQFDLVKSGTKAAGEVISVNPVFLKAGTPTPGGFVMNLQPSVAEAGFDIRLPPTADTESLQRRIAEEWAPSSRNMTFAFKQKEEVRDKLGRVMVTKTDESNPWWALLHDAVKKAGGQFADPEIFPAATDARYFRYHGIPAINFSPMANTPILLHQHNEFLNRDEYVRGIRVYESIIEAYASYGGDVKTQLVKEEL